MAAVEQDVFLFHGTIADNIRFGRPDADDAQIRAAAEAANAREFIDGLDEGYDTLIGERGVRLSGGQKQRLAIARALLKDAPVLILDEATSAVDTHTELLIQEALRRLMRQRTTLVIAHRLSTVRHADCIIVLDQGRIVERGRHEDLLAAGGAYHKMIEAQQLLADVWVAPGDAEANAAG
jgi:ABC-type multidrug transport system fused ATPase/permease subunit